MKRCWICREEYANLSEEHIIPKFFGGTAYTKNFSCEECNRSTGKIEQRLNNLSVFMHYMDNADGAPEISVPTLGSRNKETKMYYGDDQSIQLTSSGYLKGEGWERPAGKEISETTTWVALEIPLFSQQQDLHRSMLKAIAALACYCGLPRNWLEAPLNYLAGDDRSLDDLKPVDLGLPPEEMFATVWIFSPPSTRTSTIYGMVTYGPISYLYTINPEVATRIEPFHIELKAYSRDLVFGEGVNDYKRWWSKTIDVTGQQAQAMQALKVGPFTVKDSKSSCLSVVEVSTSWRGSKVDDLYVPTHPLEATHGWGIRFENWLRSLQSEEMHSYFLSKVEELETSAGLPPP